MISSLWRRRGTVCTTEKKTPLGKGRGLHSGRVTPQVRANRERDHMQNIETSFHSFNRSPFVDFFDKLAFRTKYAPSEKHMAEMRANSAFVDIRHGREIRGYARDPILTVVQPNDLALQIIATLPGLFLNHVEVARDVILPDEAAKSAAFELFNSSFLQPWHGKKRCQRYIQGFTTRRTTRGERKEGRWFTWYADRPSKVTGDINCFHIEGRHQGAQAVRRLGLHHPRDLRSFNHEDYWQRSLNLYVIDLERLGRWYANRRSGSRRQGVRTERFGRLIYNRDRAAGAVLYQVFSDHPDQNLSSQCRQHSLQQLVDQLGRGPFLKRLERAHTIYCSYQTMFISNNRRR